MSSVVLKCSPGFMISVHHELRLRCYSGKRIKNQITRQSYEEKFKKESALMVDRQHEMVEEIIMFLLNSNPAAPSPSPSHLQVKAEREVEALKMELFRA
jgi:hypothetical protein